MATKNRRALDSVSFAEHAVRDALIDAGVGIERIILFSRLKHRALDSLVELRGRWDNTIFWILFVANDRELSINSDANEKKHPGERLRPQFARPSLDICELPHHWTSKP